MRIDYVRIKNFKNLEDVLVDFDQLELYTILLGPNAAGKSSFLEALICIFKFLDLERNYIDKNFEYEIKYSCRNRNIVIHYIGNKYSFEVDNIKISNQDFFKLKDQYLPKHIFTYYSGVSTKLKDNFTEHLKRYYLTIIDPKAVILDIFEIRRLFYAENIHSNFVLLAFYSFPQIEESSRAFLRDVLEIEDFQSALFVLKKPVWSKINSSKDFWGATGIVREFLESVRDIALAPISSVENVEVNYKNSERQDRLYLYISNKEKLQELAKSWTDRIPFFNALESTYISDMVEDIRIRVKKVNLNKEISYRELSEGEQQLLAVLGLLKFTREEESLILLDEPDTHLNPLWKWEYLDYMKNVITNDSHETQVILTTHDPLIIGGLERNQIRIFNKSDKSKTIVRESDIDPKGMGVAGILTSDLFSLPTILDKETQRKLNRKRYLQVRILKHELSPPEQLEYKSLKHELDSLGFYDQTNDIWYNRYLEQVSELESFQKVKFTDSELEQIDETSKDIISKLFEEKTEQ